MNFRSSQSQKYMLLEPYKYTEFLDWRKNFSNLSSEINSAFTAQSGQPIVQHMNLLCQ